MTDEQLSFDFQPPNSALPHLWTPDDIFGSSDQETVALFAEDGRVERKRVEVKAKDLGDYLSMWANTQPHGGIVFIGVGKDGTLLGCKHASTGHLNDLETTRRYCPDAKCEFKRIPIINAKGGQDFVIALRVHYRSDKLVETVDGSAYVREGEEKRKLTESEKREIRLNKGELDCESELVSLPFPGAFNLELLETYRDAFVTKRGLQHRYGIEDVLSLNKLGKRSGADFQPNLACALLFAKDARQVLPGAFIRILRYEGSEERFGHGLNSVADRLIEGPLPLQLAEAEKFIGSQIRNFTRLGRSGRFVTSPEYPTDVWLEAVVNAAVHRSYNLRHMNIFVRMFDDKMVIESPGAFFPPTTAKTIYDGHNPRNPNLMWALYYFDFVQCAYEGTRRMRRSMQEANLPEPVFAQREVGMFQVSVTLKNNIEFRKSYVRSEAAIVIDPVMYDSLSEDEKMIINWMADEKQPNVTDVMHILQKDWRAAKSILGGLERKAIVARTPGKERDRYRTYYLRKPKRSK